MKRGDAGYRVRKRVVREILVIPEPALSGGVREFPEMRVKRPLPGPKRTEARGPPFPKGVGEFRDSRNADIGREVEVGLRHRVIQEKTAGFGE